MEAGALGTQTNADASAVVRVRGYFDASHQIEPAREALVEALRIYDLPSTSLIEIKTSEVIDRDWLAEWKKGWSPVQVGSFIVAPPWIEEPTGPFDSERPQLASGLIHDCIVIRINPGMAFGTGTHETTRLCLKAVEKYFRGTSVLDVGTGTGILAIAAAKMFPEARVEACDTDADAIAIAKDNAQLNGVADRIDFRVGSVAEDTSSADLVCANLTTQTILQMLPQLLSVTCEHLVLSGILESQVPQVEARLFQLGAPIVEMDTDSEWLVLVI